MKQSSVTALAQATVSDMTDGFHTYPIKGGPVHLEPGDALWLVAVEGGEAVVEIDRESHHESQATSRPVASDCL